MKPNKITIGLYIAEGIANRYRDFLREYNITPTHLFISPRDQRELIKALYHEGTSLDKYMGMTVISFNTNMPPIVGILK
jgi:hypothetical protein